MVNIITGARDSGKSTRFFQLWKETGETDKGVFSQKRKNAEGNVDGYDLVLLPSLQTHPLAYLYNSTTPYPAEFNLLHGRFIFSQQAFENATEYILSHPFTSVWIDEVGKLEFRELGYTRLLRVLLKKNTDITLTIRNSYIPTFLTIYQVTDFQII